MLKRWLFAFVFTQIVEIPIYRRFFGASFLEAAGASCLTHPLLWFVFVPLARSRLHLGYVEYAALGEALVVVVEALYFKLAFKRERALLGSLLANGASYGLALVAHRAFGTL